MNATNFQVLVALFFEACMGRPMDEADSDWKYEAKVQTQVGQMGFFLSNEDTGLEFSSWATNLPEAMENMKLVLTDFMTEEDRAFLSGSRDA